MGTRTTVDIAAALLACACAASAPGYGFTCIASGVPCTTVGTSAGVAPTGPVDATGAGESRVVTLALASTVTFDQILASLGGDSRIGLNMTSAGGSFVLDSLAPASIPLPAALPLMFVGLVGMGFATCRRRPD